MEFEKTIEFNYYPDLLDLLDDKAINTPLSYIYQVFAADALNLVNIVKKKATQHTRLILKILSRPVIDIREFYEPVESLGNIPKNWH